jgi:MFS transporter, OFA family, oxalate/formate antiporter
MNHKRWLIVVGALLMQPCLGTIYAWGVFVPHLKASRSELTVTLSAKLLGVDPTEHAKLAAEYLELKKQVADAHTSARAEAQSELDHFLTDIVPKKMQVSEEVWARHHYGYTGTQAQAIFGTGIMVFSLMMVFAGRWQDRVGPRRVAMTAGLVLAAAYALAALAGPNFWVVWLAIGVIGGAGIGLGYVCPVAACVKWFPDMRGLITGLAVAGFGGGAFLFSNLAGKWGELISREGVSGTWLTFAGVFAVAITAGASLLRNPPAGWQPVGWSPPALAAERAVAPHEWTGSQAIRTVTFWEMWVAFLFAGGCGMMIISSLKDFGVNQGGLSAAQTGGLVGLLALSNAAGRITWGWISQWLSPRRTLILISLLQALMVAVLIELSSSVGALEIAACWVGFHFGGNMALFPLLTASYYGTKNLGTNYGLVFTGYGVGGWFFPMLAGQAWDHLHSYLWAFVPAAAGCLLAMGLALAMRPPRWNAPGLRSEA